MASICNDERAPFGVMSGHARKTLSLSGRVLVALRSGLDGPWAARCGSQLSSAQGKRLPTVMGGARGASQSVPDQPAADGGAWGYRYRRMALPPSTASQDPHPSNCTLPSGFVRVAVPPARTSHCQVEPRTLALPRTQHGNSLNRSKSVSAPMMRARRKNHWVWTGVSLKSLQNSPPASNPRSSTATPPSCGARVSGGLRAGPSADVKHGASAATPVNRPTMTCRLSRKCGFATFLDPRGGRPASAGLGALIRVASIAL